MSSDAFSVTMPVRGDLRVQIPSEATWESYRVYYRETGKSLWLPLGVGASERMVLDGLPRDGSYEVAVAPVLNGTEAPEDSWTVVPWVPDTTDFTAPAAVSNFAAGQDGNQVRLSWDPVSVGWLDHYEIRYLGSSASTTWENGVVVARVRAPLTGVTLGAWATGVQAWRIKAVTAQGLKSATATAVSIDVEADSYAPVQATADESGGGFTGTKTNTEVSGGNLQIKAAPASHTAASTLHSAASWTAYLPHYGSGTYVTAWTDVGAIVRERVEVALAAAHASSSWTHAEAHLMCRAPSYVEGDRLLGRRITRDGYDVDGVQVLVEIDTAQDATPTPDGWRVWVPGATYLYRQVRLRLTVSSITHRNVVVSTFTWKRRRLNRKDETSVSVTATGGTDASWTTPFTVAPKVTATVIGTAARFASVSNVSTTGCKVRVFDTDGTELDTGDVHLVALGV